MQSVNYTRPGPALPLQVDSENASGVQRTTKIDQPHFKESCRYSQSIEGICHNRKILLTMSCSCKTGRPAQEQHFNSACHFVQWLDTSTGIYYHIRKCVCGQPQQIYP